ncbi:MAG TPA: hypothetical protein VFS42_10305 [Burkholderiaceae bacterium]|nr:hypothetical protein [Burkholderiaceae bacterium]
MDPRVQLRYWALAALFALATPAVFAQPSLAPTGSLGFKALPDTRFFDIPINSSWSVVSHLALPTPASANGLKFDLGGGYGWRLSPRARLSFSAELGLADETPPHWTAGDVSGQTNTTYNGTGSTSLNPRDVSFNLLWNWRYSESFAFTSGLGVRYSLTDAAANGWAPPAKPASASGYIGLRYKF